MNTLNRSLLFIGAFVISAAQVFADVKHISNQQELERLIKSGNVVVKFSAEWCGPCKTMKPIFEQVEKDTAKRSSNIVFIEVNTDKMQKIVKKLKISGIPTFIFFKNGKEVTRTVGAMSKADFQTKVESTLS